MAARDGAAGGTSSARRRRERRQRSWWRHEQLSVAAALASARHHSAGPGVVTRSEEQQEEVEHVTNDGLRAQNTPPPGLRPEQLPAAPGPQLAAVTVGYVAGGAPLVVAPVAAHDGLDDATVQFLLAQTLLAKQQEDEEARQAEELREWEDKFGSVFAAKSTGKLVFFCCHSAVLVWAGFAVMTHFARCFSVVGRPAARSASWLVWLSRTVVPRYRGRARRRPLQWPVLGCFCC